MEKRDAARLMYMEGYSQTDISRILQISENTVSKWSSDAKWKQQKISAQLMEDNAVQRVMEIIDYQTNQLIKKKNNWIKDDPDSINLIDKGDIDALQKLFSCIRKETHKFNAYATVMKEFFEYLQLSDLELAKQLTSHGDGFLQHVRTKM